MVSYLNHYCVSLRQSYLKLVPKLEGYSQLEVPIEANVLNNLENKGINGHTYDFHSVGSIKIDVRHFERNIEIENEHIDRWTYVDIV